jgi:hypothetical protein
VPRIFRVEERLYADDDNVPGKYLARLIIWRRVIPLDGKPADDQPDSFQGKRRVVLDTQGFGMVDFECVISPTEGLTPIATKGRTDDEIITEAFKRFDAAFKPVYEANIVRARAQFAQQVAAAQRMAAVAQGQVPPALDPNHVMGPGDPGFGQLAEAARRVNPAAKGKIQIAHR